jgi:predicted RNase H-like nuclease (RuvC/YqgF family)
MSSRKAPSGGSNWEPRSPRWPRLRGESQCVVPLASRASERCREDVSWEGHKRIEEGRIAELERKVGRQAMEIDFLRRCLQRVEEQRRLQALTTPS